MSLKGNGVILFIRITLSLLIAALILSFPFYTFESATYDARFRLTPTHKTSGKIETISIDSKTISKLQRDLNLEDHNSALKNVIREAPRAIVYITQPQNLTADLKTKKEFATLAASANDFVISYDGYPFKGQENKLILPTPFQDIKHIPGILSEDTNNFAGDGVTRRALIYCYDCDTYQRKWFMQPYLAQKFTPIESPANYRGSFEFRNTSQILVDHKPTGTFHKTSFVDVLENRFPLGLFKDKIVIIGMDTGTETDYYLKSVYSRDNMSISKLEVHANIIDTLIQNSGIKKLPQWVDFLLTSLISIFVVFIVFSLKPLPGLAALFLSLATFLLASWICFEAFGVAIGMAHPILAIFISYYFFIPYRLISENRKGWEYQQKNKLLTQVEELKTNFLGMMSHDLKTPLARIQGMADIALTDNSALTPIQIDALKTISSSSEELTDFITSILDLTRVESQKIKLNLESKDINEILNSVINKYEYLAKEKGITIITELETLFSIKIDAHLMRQVFSNLIENAIKYSPQSSRILISTEEIGNKIIVQVADQGIGIPYEELPNVFMKFYRSSRVKNLNVKGSGLGLYLAKYFVELHKGQISVESQPSQGSTFTVDLPNT